MAIAKNSGKQVSTQLLAQRAYEIGINEYMRQPIKAMKRLRASAWKKYKVAKPTAREIRSEFLQNELNYEKKKDTKT